MTKTVEIAIKHNYGEAFTETWKRQVKVPTRATVYTKNGRNGKQVYDPQTGRYSGKQYAKTQKVVATQTDDRPTMFLANTMLVFALALIIAAAFQM